VTAIVDQCPRCFRMSCRCPSLDEVPWLPGEPPLDVDIEANWAQPLQDAPPDEPLFVDVATILSKGIPPPPKPVLLTREDGHALFYAGKVNVLFGDPECGKTWIALAAVVEALNAGRRAAILDLDHNGAGEILTRLLALGAHRDHLGDPDRFRLAEPEAQDDLILVVSALKAWRAAVVVVDSLGELLPMLGLNSSSPDDYTSAHRRALTPMSNAGAVVVAIDHLPKGEESRERGQTGTMAKKRAINGVSLRVTVAEQFAPGRGGAANMTIEKDRPGGVRANCPVAGKNQPAGRFVMTPGADGTLSWRVTKPKLAPVADGAPDADVAELDGLLPPPRSQRDVQERLKWGSNRALKALQRWRDLRQSSDGEEE
jgi:hypothetical protein